MDNRTRYQEIFLGEARTHIRTMEHALVALEQTPARFDLINRIMRAAHSLKGDAKMMGYDACTDLAHHIETPLQRLRKENKAISPELITLLFRSLDTLEKFLADPLAEPPDDFTALLEALARAESLIAMAAAAVPSAAMPEVSFPLPPLADLRVNPTHLDNVLHLVEEMISNQSELLRLRDELNHPALDRAMHKHKRLLTELRDAVLQTRLVPVMQMFAGFPRLVREMATNLNKETVLIIEGADTELDRALLEPVHQMVGHLLRNAMVHGIEPPAERARAGKLREGTIRLAAHREREYVVIEVHDDGRGLDSTRIMEAASMHGYSHAQLAQMSRDQLWQIICEPGFSTLSDEEVSEVAGRGMGLDAVKQDIAALRGQLEIFSGSNGDMAGAEAASGTCFRLKLPLTLAIAEVLLVSVAAEVYAIPEVQVRRVVPLGTLKISELQDLTLHSLRDLLEVPPTHDKVRYSQYAVVLETDDARAALLVDRLLGKEDVVVKPLNGIQTIAGIAGATVLGEGQIVLVLDAVKLLAG